MEAEIVEFLQVLSGGADLAIIALAGILLRHDRRIAKLEYSEFGFDKQEK